MVPDIDALDRRTVLQGAAGVLVAGALAGCSGGSGDGGSNDTEDSATETEATGGDATTEAGTGTTEAATTTATTATTDAGPTDEGTTSTTPGTSATATTDGGSGTTVGTGAVEEYLAEATGYDGSIADETGSGSVEIAVGAGENGYAFDPAAVRVSPGTTITWAWTGEGSAHNVVSKGDGPLDSGEPAMGEDVTYEATLDSPGVYRYYCNPHQSLGMKGAVVVANE